METLTCCPVCKRENIVLNEAFPSECMDCGAEWNVDNEITFDPINEIKDLEDHKKKYSWPEVNL